MTSQKDAHRKIPRSATTLVESDPQWPLVYATEAERIGTALVRLPHRLEHIGSTSVPGLPARPVVDILLAVPDSADESGYVPALEGLGYGLAVREPDRFEHRVLRHPGGSPGVDHIELHVFTAGSPEIGRLTGFRDRLRTHPADRARYARAERELSRRTWERVQDYADARTEVVAEILSRAGQD